MIIPQEIRYVLLRFIVKSRFLTTFYYYLKRTYHFEQRCVLAGRLRYQEMGRDKNGFPIYHLIRNIHRLEKGLCMPDRRPIFAEGYILETVKILDKVIWVQGAEQMASGVGETVAWAFDVLAKYFQVLEETPTIREARESFQRLLERARYEPAGRVPYRRKRVLRSNVSYESLRQLAIQRRSVRWYQQRLVPREEIDRAIEIAVLSPSACNRQAFEFRIYDEASRIAQICKLATGTRGFDENIPCLIVLVGKQCAYLDERDRHVVYIDGGLAAMAFQLALETLGLASTCINWPSVYYRERALQKLLGLREDESVIMLMAVGYPDPEGLIPYSQKKPLQLLRSYDET